MNRPLLSRRAVAFLARAGTVGSAVMLVLTLFTLSPGEVDPASAAGTQVGPATVINPADPGQQGAGQPLNSGNGDTPFKLFLGASPTCPGDSSNGGYNVTSFMVPSSVNVSELQFDPITGPNPQAFGTFATLRLPLFVADGGAPYTGAQTADANPAGGPGPVINIPAFKLSTGADLGPGDIPAGTYKIGIACVKGPASATQLSNFWSVEIVVAAAPSGQGGATQITWTVPTGTGTTSTTAASGGSTSTTASGGSTSTTASGGSTSTTASGGSTSTTASGGSTSTTRASAAGTTGGVSGSGGTLPTTGSSPEAMLMWAFFLVVCGRMAVVLSRPPKVKTPGA
jgi:hypothetical protein